MSNGFRYTWPISYIFMNQKHINYLAYYVRWPKSVFVIQLPMLIFFSDLFNLCVDRRERGYVNAKYNFFTNFSHLPHLISLVIVCKIPPCVNYSLHCNTLSDFREFTKNDESFATGVILEKQSKPISCHTITLSCCCVSLFSWTINLVHISTPFQRLLIIT